jgi:hypothetical protein
MVGEIGISEAMHLSNMKALRHTRQLKRDILALLIPR